MPNYCVAAVSVVLSLFAAGCSKQQVVERGPARPNVLLIIIDTLRVDKLGCYGSDLGATPRIDALAGTGVRFQRAYSHAPWTLPACASILTSLYPPQHGAGGHLPVEYLRKLPDSVTTVAECFRDAGYATAAVVNVDFLTASFGMTQGFAHVDFEVYASNVRVRPAGRTTDAALGWLGANGHQPFFLMVHYFDPHLVYAPPGEFRRRFADPQDQKDASWVFGTRRQIVAYRRGLVDFGQATIRRAEHLYNGEVAYADHEVGRLLDGLERLGLSDSTVVALTADHGEEFLDHGGFEHGHTLHEELVRIPLIIRTPQNIQGQTVESVVAHVDLAPTFCELAGIKAAPSFAGSSLVGLMKGRKHEDHPVLFEGNFWGKPLRGCLQGGYKLIRSGERAPLLFDIVADPSEKKDLYQLEPQHTARLSQFLDRTYASISRETEETNVQLSPEELHRLESLGYVGD